MSIDATDRALIEATQSGLPLVPRPYLAIGEAIGVSEGEALERMRALAARGVVRRIAAAPNHYALGLVANGMTVWDVADEAVSELGPKVGALPFVSHSYRRPRALPLWPYNLFAMVHGTNRDQVESKRAEIAVLLGDASRASDILYSTRILKKTGLRLRRKEG
jgi:DNA-binding Lrp family transcriptional regulator